MRTDLHPVEVAQILLTVIKMDGPPTGTPDTEQVATEGSQQTGYARLYMEPYVDPIEGLKMRYFCTNRSGTSKLDLRKDQFSEMYRTADHRLVQVRDQWLDPEDPS